MRKENMESNFLNPNYKCTFKKCKIKLFTLFMFKYIYFIEENPFISCRYIHIILVVASHFYMDAL